MKKEMKTVTIGTLGAGYAAYLHGSGYEKVSGVNVRLKTICDIKLELAERVMERFGYEQMTADYDEMLADPEIDVIDILDDNTVAFDHLIFLDSASGTLGTTQIKLIEEGVLNGRYANGESIYRYTFVFSHTNIFKPQFNEFASTFTREETFYLLDKFEEWNVTCVFCGHVHTWDERNFNGVHYLTLDTMCEANNPDPGDYILRIHIEKDRYAYWTPVHMDSVGPKKK